MAKLTDPVTILRGVGPARAKQLAQLNIQTLGDLICHFPRGYEDRTQLVQIQDLQPDIPACFRAMVLSVPRTSHIRKGLDITRVQVGDTTARLNLTFFNQNFVSDNLLYGHEYIFYGAVSGDFIGYSMNTPVFESPDSPPLTTRRILPVYPLTAGLANAAMLRLIQQAMAICDPPAEILPAPILEQYQILPAAQTYRVIHAPGSLAEAEQAKRRMIFEEFFVFSAGLALLRAAQAGKKAVPYANLTLTPFTQALPFSLTGAQRRAIGEIAADFQKGVPMNRLVQGDVGSGKTMVAAAAAYLAGKNGDQTALMVPTEILAEQHYASISKLLVPLGIRVGLLTGAMRTGEKRLARENLASGQLDLVIGTHALLSQTTVFSNLGLVITDEQHRFGVAQRAALLGKGQDPHLLVMSATPIPRTLALLMYGDLEVSILDELPPGRQSVQSFLVSEFMRPRINAFIRKQAALGHQCYIVCPAVADNPEQNLKAAETWADTLRRTVFPELRISLLHGQMKGAEKEAVMASFARGESDILVATTVIEVGVDVPNATVMVIEDADRFGLSQLHQLRGRVGRGKEQSYCVLFTRNRNPQTLSRLKALCKTADGFRIAEEDLKIRGPGDFFGARQSGLPAFRVANLSSDLELLQQAQQAASSWIDCHGAEMTPQAQALRSRIKALFDRAQGTMN